MEEIRPPLQDPRKQTIWSRNYICIFVAQAFMSLSQQSVNILIARYARESLGVSDVLMGNLVGLYYGVALAMRPIAGPLQMKLNRRNLLVAVFATGAIVNLGYASFNTTGAFVAFRIIQGIQYAFMGSLTMIIAVDSLPKERLASGIAMYGLGSTVMQTIAPNIGLWLRDLGPKLKDGLEGITLGYHYAFYFAAFILALAVIPLMMIRYENQGKEEGEAGGVKWYKTIISVHTIPMTFVVLMSYISTAGYRSYIDAFANEVGIPSIGLFATVTAIVMLCTRPFSGRLMEKYGTKKIIPIAMLFMGGGIVVIATSRTLPSVLVGGALTSLGNGFITPGLQAMCVQTETVHRRAIASNTMYAGIDMGLYIGPVWGGIVVSKYNFSVTIMSGLIPLALAMILFFIFIPGYTRRRENIETEEAKTGG